MKIKEIIQELKNNIDTILFFLKVAFVICLAVVSAVLVYKATDIKPLGYTAGAFIIFLWWLYEVLYDVREEMWKNLKEKIQKIFKRNK